MEILMKRNLARGYNIISALLFLFLQKNYVCSASFTLPASVPKTATSVETKKLSASPAIQAKALSNGEWKTFQIASSNFPSSSYGNSSRRNKSVLSSTATGTGQSDGESGGSRDNSTNIDHKNSDVAVRRQLFIEGPPLETKPNYDEIHGPLGPFLDKIFLIVFRSKFAASVGIDSKLPKNNYQGLMELTAALNAKYSDKAQVRATAQNVLRSLFPSWLPGAFGVMFAKPFPDFSSRMNAWATWVAGTWLMGECEINDCEIDGGKIGHQQGLLVKRCRFLEECGCASVCVNSCKIPTQKFFNEDMKLPLTMTPNYETGECQFSFGLTPTEQGEFDAMDTPCFQRCPSAGTLRQWHSGPSANISQSSKCRDM